MVSCTGCLFTWAFLDYGLFRIPQNAQFEVDDYTRDWVHPPNSFDFIHARTLAATVGDWQKMYGEVFQALKPGGWFEHLEATTLLESDDNSIPVPSRVHEWANWLDIAGSAVGKSWKIAEHMKGWMKNARFTEIHETVYRLPIGNWPKDEKYKAIGQFNLLNILEGAGMLTRFSYQLMKTTSQYTNNQICTQRAGHWLCLREY